MANVDRPGETNVGLFARAYGSPRFNNIALENVDIKGGTRIGGIVGFIDVDTSSVSPGSTTVSGSYTTGKISGSNVGGLVGSIDGRGSVTKNYSRANITATGTSGGILGSSITTNQKSASGNNNYFAGRINRGGGIIGSAGRDGRFDYPTNGWAIDVDSNTANQIGRGMLLSEINEAIKGLRN